MPIAIIPRSLRSRLVILTVVLVLAIIIAGAAVAFLTEHASWDLLSLSSSSSSSLREAKVARTITDQNHHHQNHHHHQGVLLGTPPRCLNIRGASGGQWFYSGHPASEEEEEEAEEARLLPAASYPYPYPYQSSNNSNNNSYNNSSNNSNNNSNSYLIQNQYRWQDADKSCQIGVCTLDKMCLALEQLNITRLFFVGDSLTFLQVQSLWQLLFGFLLGDKDDHNNEIGKKEQFQGLDRLVTTCPPTSTTTATTATATTIDTQSNFTFSIVFTRNDKLSLTEQNGPCMGGFCNSWIHKYRSSNERTLFVANFGAHIHQSQVFMSRFDTFVNAMKTITTTTMMEAGHSEDLVFFRTSVPGHSGCAKNNTPLADEREFRSRFAGKDHYDWGKMGIYNDYAKKQLLLKQSNNNNDNDNNDRRWFLLDVYPMTVLRPDGHSDPPVDCLHYLLPGAPDWWNHLMYSILADIADARMSD